MIFGITFLLIESGLVASISSSESTINISELGHTLHVDDSESKNYCSIQSAINYINESHLIPGVPIIGQDNRFYCHISSHTMLLNYYGFNLTKYEVFYFMGGGFSLFYHPSRYLKPYSSSGCAFRPSNYDYIASLLDLEFQPFHVDLTLPEDIVWGKIWNCIKENISLNQPVVVNLDGAILFADHIGIKIPTTIWKNIPINASHAVIVVGYNETNQSICYNDPQYSNFGDEQRGSYVWVDTEIFKTSFRRFSSIFPSTYRIKSYKKPVNVSYNKEEIIEQAYYRNIKRLQGDYRYYVSDIDFPNSYNLTSNFTYGINASKEIKKIFGNGLQTQLYTILQYKLAAKLGIKNTFFNILELIFQRLFEKDISYVLDLTIPGYENIYRKIAEEKQIVSDVLSNYSYQSPEYQTCSDLLQNESELWLKFAAYDRILRNKGFFITTLRALHMFNQMEMIMEEIIQIEQNILSFERGLVST